MSNPGTTGLVAWWALDGDGTDSHGANDLTNSGASWVAGLVGSAADLEASESDYLYLADNADLSMGDIGMTVCAWVQIESGTGHPIVSKWQTAGNREYVLYATASTFRWLVSHDGSTNSSAASWSATYTPGVWYFVVAYHDPTANTLGISVNGAAAVTVSHSTGIYNGASRLGVGDSVLLFGGAKLDGKIDEVCIYKNRVLTADEIIWLYNSGAGRAYADLTSAGGLPLIIAAQMAAW